MFRLVENENSIGLGRGILRIKLSAVWGRSLRRFAVHVWFGKVVIPKFLTCFGWTSIIIVFPNLCPNSLDDPCLVLTIKDVCKLREFSNSSVTVHRNKAEVIFLIDSATCRRQCKTESKKAVGVIILCEMISRIETRRLSAFHFEQKATLQL